MTILGKKQMSEEDIKLNFITPAIQRGWKGHITMETRITDGRINIRGGNIVVRSKPKFADYLLYLNDGKADCRCGSKGQQPLCISWIAASDDIRSDDGLAVCIFVKRRRVL